jgi:hypothetical protein
LHERKSSRDERGNGGGGGGGGRHRIGYSNIKKILILLQAKNCYFLQFNPLVDSKSLIFACYRARVSNRLLLLLIVVVVVLF